MKNLVSWLSAIALFQGAVAVPHANDFHHNHVERHVEVEYVTIPSEIIVWVNQYGSTIRVETKGCISTKPVQTLAMPTVAPVVPSSSWTPVFHEPSSAAEVSSVSATAIPSAQGPAPQETSTVTVVSAHPSSSSPILVPSTAASASSYEPPVESSLQPAVSSPTAHQLSNPPHFVPGPASIPTDKIGISYSPYNADSTCKSQDEVYSDFEKMVDYALVRIYGVDCNQVTTVTNAANKHNMKIFAGINDLTNVAGNLKTLIDAANGNWSPFDTISIGNELVNSGKNSPGDVVNAVNSARQTLRSAGYNGPVVTVDTFEVMIKNPELCQASDYCAANCHAFFDSYMTPQQAGPYVKNQAEQVSKAAGGKPTVITESGWPSAGLTNGDAVPSKANQQIAIQSLKNSFSNGGIILFTAFDDKWKQNNRYTFDAEQHWGIL